MPRRRRIPVRVMKWAGRAWLVVVSTLSVLALAEVALRLAGAGKSDSRLWHTSFLHRPDPDLIFSLRPGAEARWETSEFVEIVHISPQGLRNPELLETGSRPRILILGDSMTFGHGVSDEDPYPRRLQELFESRGETIEVINAGTKGFGSDQSHKLFAARLRALDPELVIFAHYWNDLHENVFQPLYLVEGDELVERDATRHVLYRLGRLHETLPEAVLELRLTRVLFSALLARGSRPLDASVYGENPIAWSRRKFLLLMADLRRMSGEDGFDLLVLAVPDRDGGPKRYDWMRRLEDMEVAFFDAHADPVWKRQSSRLFFENDDHLTPAGHRRLAKQLHRFLEREQLVPGERAGGGKR
jgi:lysophospholipase L1-like esterase